MNQDLKHVVVHTGQHYDYDMSGAFFEYLGMEPPDVNLHIGPVHTAYKQEPCWVN